MTINEYLAEHKAIWRLELKCNDGLRLSVQANEAHYCNPRSNTGPYSSVEVGFPSEMVPELLDYTRDRNNPTNAVYGWVPVELVDAIIAKHGEIKVNE